MSSVAPIAAPFSKKLILGYRDGALAGVMQCGHCEEVYRFDFLDWGKGRETRIVSLAPLPATSFGRLIELITQAQNAAPEWPFWCPVWEFPTEAAKTLADVALWQILKTAGPPQLIIAIDPWIKQVRAARDITPEQIQTVPDWFACLNVSREVPHEWA
jgi:hypothetical protein